MESYQEEQKGPDCDEYRKIERGKREEKVEGAR